MNGFKRVFPVVAVLALLLTAQDRAYARPKGATGLEGLSAFSLLNENVRVLNKRPEKRALVPKGTVGEPSMADGPPPSGASGSAPFSIAEHLYGKAPNSTESARWAWLIGPDRRLSGGSVVFDLVPGLRVGGLAVFDHEERDCFLGPVINYMFEKERWLTAGIQLYTGDRGDYEGLSDIFYAEIKFAF